MTKCREVSLVSSLCRGKVGAQAVCHEESAPGLRKKTTCVKGPSVCLVSGTPEMWPETSAVPTFTCCVPKAPAATCPRSPWGSSQAVTSSPFTHCPGTSLISHSPAGIQRGNKKQLIFVRNIRDPCSEAYLSSTQHHSKL